MNRAHFLTIPLLLAVIAPMPALAQGYWHPVSQDQHIQLIRNFEGDQSLAIVADPNFPNQEFKNGVYKYSLFPDSLDFFSRRDMRSQNLLAFYGMEDISSLEPKAMSQASAQQIAQSFMQSHFPEPQKIALLKTIPEDLDTFVTSYRFIFAQDVGNGVVGPSRCTIDVDTVYGRITYYAASNPPILAPTVPSLTADKAIAAALAAFAPNGGGIAVEIESVGMTNPDAFGNETIYYAIILGYPNVRAIIDGFDGHVLDSDALAGTSKPDSKWLERTRKAKLLPRLKLNLLSVSRGMEKPHTANRSPLLLDNNAYLPADYLRCGDRAAKVTWAADHKSYSLVTPRHQLAFTIGQKQYTLDGNKQSLKHSPAVVLDQPYVPLELAEKLMPYHLTYLAATKTVHFEPIAKKTASTAPSVVPVSTH